MNKIIRDGQFYLCLALGPLSWWLLSFVFPMRDISGIPALAWSQLALIIFVYPILEEIVFRGLIQEFLAKRVSFRLGLLTMANIVTSLVFVMTHLIYSPWHWALLVFFPSLVFGYMKERHQSLLPSILLHGFYNLGFYGLFWV